MTADEWHDIIATIKDWVLPDDESIDDDRPTPDAAIDAIKWCNAHTDEESPDAAVPSGDGCVALDWHGEQGIEECLDFDGSGEATRTTYGDSKVLAKSRVSIVTPGEGE